MAEMAFCRVPNRAAGIGAFRTALGLVLLVVTLVAAVAAAVVVFGTVEVVDVSVVMALTSSDDNECDEETGVVPADAEVAGGTDAETAGDDTGNVDAVVDVTATAAG